MANTPGLMSSANATTAGTVMSVMASATLVARAKIGAGALVGFTRISSCAWFARNTPRLHSVEVDLPGEGLEHLDQELARREDGGEVARAVQLAVGARPAENSPRPALHQGGDVTLWMQLDVEGATPVRAGEVLDHGRHADRGVW